MKTPLLVVTVLCLSTLLLACEPIHPLPSANPAPVLTAHEQANLTVVQNLYQALTRGNIDVLFDVYAEAYTKHFAGEIGTLSLEQAYLVLRQEGLTTTERRQQNLIKQLHEADQRGERRPQCCASCEL